MQLYISAVIVHTEEEGPVLFGIAHLLDLDLSACYNLNMFTGNTGDFWIFSTLFLITELAKKLHLIPVPYLDLSQLV